MAGAKLNLAVLQDLITLGGYGGRGSFSASSSVIGLSAALFLYDMSIWQGAGDVLTVDELDDIDELIALLEYDLMVTDDMFPQDRVQVTHDANQLISTGAGQIPAFNTEVYDPQDMHDPVTNNGRIYVLNDGLHLIEANFIINVAAVGYRQLHLSKYDAVLESSKALAVTRTPNVIATATYSISLQMQDYAHEDDYYYLVLTQNSGANMTLYALDYSPIFSVVRLWTNEQAERR